eukprot:480427-Pyramimonas_sp.AAC.1
MPRLTNTQTCFQTYSYSDLLVLRPFHCLIYSTHAADCEGASGGALAPAPLRGAARGVFQAHFLSGYRKRSVSPQDPPGCAGNLAP